VFGIAFSALDSVKDQLTDGRHGDYLGIELGLTW
jgi:hypothetical protein